VFIKVGSHHRVEDFQARGREPAEEVQIYTWCVSLRPSLALLPAPTRLLTHPGPPHRKDATLREMANLVKEVNPTARGSRARLSFALVFPDHRCALPPVHAPACQLNILNSSCVMMMVTRSTTHRGRYQIKNVGMVFSTKRSEDDKKTLDSVRFVSGDYLDVAIHTD
jgi:histone deacetylase complex subunit SAP18